MSDLDRFVKRIRERLGIGEQTLLFTSCVNCICFSFVFFSFIAHFNFRIGGEQQHFERSSGRGLQSLLCFFSE